MPSHTQQYRALLERLQRARDDAGLTQAEAARALGRPQSLISKIETGERRLDPVELQTLARLYRTTVAAILPEPSADSLRDDPRGNWRG